MLARASRLVCRAPVRRFTPFASGNSKVLLPQRMCFSNVLNTQSSNGRKINTQTLCDITGTKYYAHNEEITLDDDRIVKVFDENEVLIGDLKFADAVAISRTFEKDIVLRNAKTDPPICKIMNYKMELMKRLFKKLGRSQQTAAGKDTK